MNENGVIFLLENSPDYLFSLDQEFRNAGLSDQIRVARYGNEAILYLKGVGIYAERTHYPLPDLLIVDLSLADGSAMAVMGWLRRQEDFKDLPVLVLVPPAQEHLMAEVFFRDTNAFFVRRDDLHGVVQAISDLKKLHEIEPRKSPAAPVALT